MLFDTFLAVNFSALQLLVILVCLLIPTYYLGKHALIKNLKHDIYHLEMERNNLHVKYMQLREMLDNQELDIKRYAAELQLFVEMQQEWTKEKLELKIKIDQYSSPDGSSSVGSIDLLNKILKSNLAQSERTIEGLKARLQATEQVLQFMRESAKKNQIV